MRILFDINHPAHVHYSRNIIKILEERGHAVQVVSRDRNPCFDLLRYYNISFKSRGKGSNSLFGKLAYIPIGDIRLYNYSKQFKPDILVCFMSPYAAHVGRFLSKPSVVIDDTEHAKLHDRTTYPFATNILTSTSFYRDLGPKQLRFNGFLELNYLLPNRFTPDPSVLEESGLSPGEKFIIIRLVAWGGHHDRGQKGIGIQAQRDLLDAISKNYKVLISSEGQLPDEFSKYRLKIKPEKIHSILAFASYFIGESGTMAAECAVLGTPSIYINSLPLMGYLQEASKNGLLFHFQNDENIVEKVIDIIRMKPLKEMYLENLKRHLEDKIDTTNFFVWFLENYPHSVDKLRKDPEYANLAFKIK
jgi:uncharacterized protein